MLTLLAPLFRIGADEDFVPKTWCHLCFGVQAAIRRWSLPSVEDVDWASSSRRSLSEVDVRQGDDEHSEFHVKFVELGERDGDVCVAAFMAL